MAALWSRYMRLLEVYPLPTKAVTSGVLFTAGDGIAQYVDGTIQKRGYNVDRGLKATVWGGIIFAPLAHVWYNRVLERYVPGTSTRAVLTKVFLDQTAWAVAINSLYLSYVYETTLRRLCPPHIPQSQPLTAAPLPSPLFCSERLPPTAAAWRMRRRPSRRRCGR